MSPLLRRGVIVGALAGLVVAAWKYLGSRAPDTGGVTYRPQTFPLPPQPFPTHEPPPSLRTATAPGRSSVDPSSVDGASVEPDADGNCPLTHPIKGKRGTGIYHPPGAFAYERTRADRCYRDEAAAESDGLRAAKR
jgi:hypothetical protein